MCKGSTCLSKPDFKVAQWEEASPMIFISLSFIKYFRLKTKIILQNKQKLEQTIEQINRTKKIIVLAHNV